MRATRLFFLFLVVVVSACDSGDIQENSVPTLKSPADNASSQPITLPFSWVQADVGDTYRFQIAINSHFESMILDRSGIADTTTTAYNLRYNTGYFWRLSVQNAHGVSGWTTRHFRTVSGLSDPGPPTLISPFTSSVTEPTSSALIWHSVADASSYRLQLSRDEGFTNLVFDLNGITDTTKVVIALAEDFAYFWRVSANNVSGSSPWSTDAFQTTNDRAGPPFETSENSIRLKLVHIPAGAYRMGFDDGYLWGQPKHDVLLTSDFWIGAFEVTQGEYFEITGLRPSRYTGDDRMPVENVSWFDAVNFAVKLSLREGLDPCYNDDGSVIGTDSRGDIYGLIYACDGYRLPTNAEWEYMARAGSTTLYSFGNDPDQLTDYAWYRANSEDMTHVVGQKLPNWWGIYDVHGNVTEWVQDNWGPNYFTTSGTINPPGLPLSRERVVRSHRFNDWGDQQQTAQHRYQLPDRGFRHRGFRIARTIK